MKRPLLTIAVCTMALLVQAQTYNMDKNHSRLGFSATHFGISHVDGRFKEFTATLNSKKEDFTDAAIEMTAVVNSIDTDTEMRDKDLRSDNWFDVTKYPTLTFKSTSFKKTDGKNYKLSGTLTIHGVSKPITFDVVYNGKAMNPMTKKNSHGFTVTGKLNRKDFSVGSGPASAVVGDEIDLRSNVEFIAD